MSPCRIALIKCGDDFILPAQEIRTCQISRDRVMSDKGTVNSQILHKKLQFFQHLLLRERIKFSALSLLQQGRTGEQGQPAGSHQHGLALAEDFRRVDRMLAAMGSACQIDILHRLYRSLKWFFSNSSRPSSRILQSSLDIALLSTDR